MIYEPREDSFLLVKTAKRYAYGKVLDMGCGTGIQGLSVIDKQEVDSVTFADINPEAIKLLKKKTRKGKKVVSDLFDKINQKHDTIIFNPPYLPEDSRVKDIALDGGRKGSELILRFLGQAPDRLSQTGQILLLFSSFSNKKMIVEMIDSSMLEYEMIESAKLDWETLYVVRIMKPQIRKKLSSYKKIEYFRKGKRGMIYTMLKGKKKLCLKIARPDSTAVHRIENEAAILKQVNSYGIGPELVDYDSYPFIIMEFVEGMLFRDYIEKAQAISIKKAVINLYNQLFILDKLGIDKKEMHRPIKHIIFAKQTNQPVLIDFERAKKTRTPQNVTQFTTFLLSIGISKYIQKPAPCAKNIRGLAAEYKKEYSEYSLGLLINGVIVGNKRISKKGL